MAKNREKILDSLGNYNLNEGYKYISGGNAEKAFQIISSQIERVKCGDYAQSKRHSYRVQSHTEEFDWNEYDRCRQQTPFREEEWICKHCMGHEFDSVGRIVDYQVPLKHARIPECAGMGKIDLLAQKGTDGYLLEVKVPNSSEEPLRAIMEVHTYWKQLGGENCQNFLENSVLTGATSLRKGIVLFEGSPILGKLTSTRSNLHAMMQEFGVECFIAQRLNAHEGLIGEILKWKL